MTGSSGRRLLLVSNRLPFTVKVTRRGLEYGQSTGGLVTGLSAFLESYRAHLPAWSPSLWIGWPGASIPDRFAQALRKEAREEHSAYPVLLTDEEMDSFYFGFCNKTIWPLFHSFPSHVVYEDDFWKTYLKVNEIFCETVREVARKDDCIWVHDYHLMLLPRLLRNSIPNVSIGFFLHIPFPSFEIFRLLPPRWRRELLEGMLGADLIGFHTYDYMRHFLQSVLRILGYEHQMGEIHLPGHIVKVETYPMGIDFERFHSAASHEETMRERKALKRMLPDARVVLSVDRLDYTKGILNRLEGFEIFLERHPEFRGKVVLAMVVVPSRIGVEHYESMKRQIEETIGRINGRFGSLGWTPILYQFRYLPFHKLVALYSMSDVALITPLRDGMNLIAKEYLASRPDMSGVLILSEMAGAAKELGEALIINPNDRGEIASALHEALLLPLEEQIRRNTILHLRLRRYDVERWASDFLNQLAEMKPVQERYAAKLLSADAIPAIVENYNASRSRLLLLDYDGTLVPLAPRPELAAPPEDLRKLLGRLAAREGTNLVIISGRDRGTIESWLGNLPVGLIAEHGFWQRLPGGDWQPFEHRAADWMQRILPILEQHADRLPGAYVEQKEHSLAWHYRPADPEQAQLVATELSDDLIHFTANIDLQVLRGNKVIEVRNTGVNKGAAVGKWLEPGAHDFILAIGDDWTDEDLFAVLPDHALSIRVGLSNTLARFNVRSQEDVLRLLTQLDESRAQA